MWINDCALGSFLGGNTRAVQAHNTSLDKAQINVNVTGTDKMRAMLQRIGPALGQNAMAQTAVKIEDYTRCSSF